MIRNLGQVAAIYIGSSAPRNTNLIWLDNTVVPFVFRAYDGSAWSEIATHKWVRAYVDGWLVTLPPRQLADDGDYMLINSNNVNYKITVKDFVKSAVGNPLDFKGVIRVSADFPNPSTLESGDMYVIITSPAGGTVTDPYSGKTFEDSEKIVWDEVTQSWESLGKIDITVDLTTSYSETEVTIHSSAGKETTIQGATDQLAGVMLPGQYSWLQALSNGSIVPGDPSPLTPLTPAHKHNYSDIINRLVSQQGTGESTIDPMSQKATTDALNLKFDKASVLQVSGAATDKVMSQKAVTDALKTLSDDFNNKLTNYLPLAGGTMKGNIVFNNNLFLNWKDTKGSTYQVLSMKSNDEINIGNAAFPLNLYSKEDLFHKRNGESVYRIYDAYNLPDPATLSGNNVFTGNNTFQAGKFNVGPFEVTSSGSLLSNINIPAGSAWSRRLVFRANNDIPSSLVFGGYNSVDNTSIGYVYIGIGDINYQTAQYKFYANSLRVPYKWSIDGPDGSAIIWSQTSEIVNLGRAAGTTKIRSGNTDLIHTKGSTEYIIWDKSNLPNPVRYALDASNYPTLLDSNGSSFSYIKAGPSGILPNTSVSLSGGGTGYCGTLGWSFKDGYFANVHTYKILIGPNETFIDSQSGDSNHRGIGFYTSQNAACPVYVGSLCVSDSYANGAPNIPTNGIYSSGAIKSAAGFTSNFRQTNLNLAKTGNDVLYISSFVEDSTGSPGIDSNTGRTINDGMLLTYFWQNDHAFQLAADIDGTGIAYRHYIPSTGNSTTGWKFLADTSWVVSKINSSTSNYLPLTGGTLSGNLTINTVGSTTFVINNNDTNGSETFMRVLRKGTASAAIGFRDSLGAYIYNYNSNKYLFIDNDGYARVGTTSGSTRLALITDIPSISGYLPLSGGTLTGALTMSSRRNNIVVDVVGGAGQSWNEGAGALSVQVPSDSRQTPLLLARRSGATINTTTLSERLLDIALLDTGTIFRVGMSGVNALELEVTSFTNKVGIGKLFGKQIATTDQIPSIPSISISNSGSGNAVTAISASGHTLTVTKGATYLTSSSLDGYATQTWANGQFAPLSRFNTSTGYTTIKVTGQEFNFDSANPEIYMNYRTLSGSTAVTKITWKAGGGANSTALCEGRWGNLYMNNNLVATQSWAAEKFPNKTGAGASGTWGISISGNATTATTASKLGSTTIGGSAKPIYLSSGTPTACSATVGSATVPVYMNAGTITQCSTTLGVSITGNAATATNSTQLGGTAASSYVKANDNISRLTNDSGYTTQEWVNSQNFVKSTSTKKVTDIQPVDALPATQASGVLYLVFG